MTRDVILTVGLLLAGGLASRVLADVLRIPDIVLLIAFGALLGPSALDVVDVPLDSTGAQLLFTFGVSSILFYGGLNLSLTVLRRVAVSLGLLAIPGVLLTTLVTGTVAALVFDLPLEHGLLIGAVLSPTDPAILIPLFLQTRLKVKVAQTVIAESAFNDPTGAVLALALAGALMSGDSGLGGPAGEFVVELGISTVVGIVAGVLLSATISSHRAGILRDSAPVAVLAVVAVSYVSLDFAGGSGYLGAFLAGLIVGNMELLGLAMHSHHEEELNISLAHAGRRRHDLRLPRRRRQPAVRHAGRPLAARAGGRRDAAARRAPAHGARLRAARPARGLDARRARVPLLDARDGRRPRRARRRARRPRRAPGRAARRRRRARDRGDAAPAGGSRAVARAAARAARPRQRSRLTAATLPVFASTRTVVNLA